jgi:hypothetical protein
MKRQTRREWPGWRPSALADRLTFVIKGLTSKSRRAAPAASRALYLTVWDCRAQRNSAVLRLSIRPCRSSEASFHFDASLKRRSSCPWRIAANLLGGTNSLAPSKTSMDQDFDRPRNVRSWRQWWVSSDSAAAARARTRAPDSLMSSLRFLVTDPASNASEPCTAF